MTVELVRWLSVIVFCLLGVYLVFETDGDHAAWVAFLIAWLMVP